jgi:hypothetical protein
MGLKRIRMRRSIIYMDNGKERAIAAGAVLEVPGDLKADVAQSWVKTGLAIEDKLDPRQLETKA